MVVAYERNTKTNARLADAGIEVLPISAAELVPAAADRDACRARRRGTCCSRRRSTLITRSVDQRQLGSHISMFQVIWDTGSPVMIGKSQAKLVTASAR